MVWRAGEVRCPAHPRSTFGESLEAPLTRSEADAAQLRPPLSRLAIGLPRNAAREAPQRDRWQRGAWRRVALQHRHRLRRRQGRHDPKNAHAQASATPLSPGTWGRPPGRPPACLAGHSHHNPNSTLPASAEAQHQRLGAAGGDERGSHIEEATTKGSGSARPRPNGEWKSPDTEDRQRDRETHKQTQKERSGRVQEEERTP